MKEKESSTHNSFIKESHILMQSFLLKSYMAGLISKLELKKLENYYCWDFLCHLLEKMDFEQRWISWIDSVYALLDSWLWLITFLQGSKAPGDSLLLFLRFDYESAELLHFCGGEVGFFHGFWVWRR